MVPIPCQRGARVGLVVFVVMWALLGAIEWCRAHEVRPTPPVIGELPRLRDRGTLADQSLRGAIVEASPPVNGTGSGCPAGTQGEECLSLDLDLDDDIPERVEVERRLSQCSRASRRSDPWMVLELVRLERDLGAPAGLLSAVVCWETGYTHGARGDYKHGRARSWGPLQMMGWWRAWCGWKPGARDDVNAAARCYWARVEHYLAQARVAECGEPMVVAEAMAANGVKYAAWGCAARSRHVEEWRGWR